MCVCMCARYSALIMMIVCLVVPPEVVTTRNNGLYALHVHCSEFDPKARPTAAEAHKRAARLYSIEELRQ